MRGSGESGAGGSSASKSFSDRLVDDLDVIEEEFRRILTRSTIRRSTLNDDVDGGLVFIGFPEYYWEESELVAERTTALTTLTEWLALFELLHRGALPETRRRIDAAKQQLGDWLERSSQDHSVPSTTEQALRIAAETFQELRDLVRLATSGSRELLLVPDTNVLLREPGVENYTAAVGADRYTAVLVPTVISELDDLKDRGRTPEVRDNAARAVRRIKGLRDRGALHNGVTVAGHVELRAEARDVRAPDILEWLSSDVPDDRILASALDLQARSPAAVVVLVTGDVNLQNKAAVVRMPFTDPFP